MIDVGSRLKGVTDREQWAARGASFVAKVKATKVVWFPPQPVETGKKAGAAATKATKKTASTARKTTGGAARKTGGAAKKTGSAAKKKTGGSARKTTAAARKTTGGTKVTKPVRRKTA